MTPIFICSRYNGTITERRCNLVEHDALCRLAITMGYAPVSPFAGVDRDNPPFDEPGEMREGVISRSGALAEMCEDIMIPEWYEFTHGMHNDYGRWVSNGVSGNALYVDPIADLAPHVPTRYRRAVEMRAMGDPAWVREFEEVMP